MFNIFALTRSDPKTLQERALKLAEEAGKWLKPFCRPLVRLDLRTKIRLLMMSARKRPMPPSLP